MLDEVGTILYGWLTIIMDQHVNLNARSLKIKIIDDNPKGWDLNVMAQFL